jgi:ferredoxin, 2Fe-2S
MPKVTFITHSGTRHEVSVPLGESLMRAATDNNVPGIDGDCGGQCACATCHVYVDSPWAEKLTAITSRETDMLSFTNELKDNSRLACQIMITEALDGLVVSMPEGQH